MNLIDKWIFSKNEVNYYRITNTEQFHQVKVWVHGHFLVQGGQKFWVEKDVN